MFQVVNSTLGSLLILFICHTDFMVYCTELSTGINVDWWRHREAYSYNTHFSKMVPGDVPEEIAQGTESCVSGLENASIAVSRRLHFISIIILVAIWIIVFI